MKNILTIDVEDWASSSLHLLSPAEADQARMHLPEYDPQVERGIRRILDLLKINNMTATFFVVGQTAEKYENLIKDIHEQGHEVASHSMTHSLFPLLSPENMKKEIKESKVRLEQVTGAGVTGFRSPNLMPYPDEQFFFDFLAECGYGYDSSYRESFSGNMDTGVREIPVSVMNLGMGKIPLGGTYFKCLPFGVISRVIGNMNKRGQPAVFYFHPYELDARPVQWPHPEPSIGANLSLLLRNIWKKHTTRRLSRLVEQFEFTSCREYLEGNPGN